MATRTRSILFAILLSLTACLRANPSTIFHIHDTELYSIDPRLFGQFLERASWEGEMGPEGALVPGTSRLQTQVLQLLSQMRIPIVRFPGGTNVDYLPWKDRISNIPGRSVERPVTITKRYGEITNIFGYDEFLRTCEQMNWQPLLVVNLRDGIAGEMPVEQAAQNAAALVAYCNAPVGAKLPGDLSKWPTLRARNGHPLPYNVHEWELGNETGFWINDLEHERTSAGADRAKVRHDLMDAYARAILEYTKAMRSVDPSIEFLLDAERGVERATLPLRQTVASSQMVFHIYAPWQIDHVERDGKPVDRSTLTQKQIWEIWMAAPAIDDNGESIIRRPLIDRARQEHFKIAVTEWNWAGWWKDDPAQGKPTLDSHLARGMGTASMLNALVRDGDVIDIACQSNLIGIAWKISAIQAYRDAGHDPYYMPSGMVTALYSNQHGDKRLSMTEEGVPTYAQPFRMSEIGAAPKVDYLDAVATGDKQRIYLHILNREFDTALPIRLDVSDCGIHTAVATQYLLTGKLDHADSEPPGPIASIKTVSLTVKDGYVDVTLPARSVSVIEVLRSQ